MMNNEKILPPLNPFEDIVKKFNQAGSANQAFQAPTSVTNFNSRFVDYPTPLLLTDEMDIRIINKYYKNFKMILNHAYSLYESIKQMETYYDKERDTKYQQEAISDLDNLILRLKSDISFISQLKDQINIKNQIELADKTLAIALTQEETSSKLLWIARVSLGLSTFAVIITCAMWFLSLLQNL